jgi:hypothetical protein
LRHCLPALLPHVLHEKDNGGGRRGECILRDVLIHCPGWRSTALAGVQFILAEPTRLAT